MQNFSKIESFLSSIDLKWDELVEVLPIGILLFDENWKIKSVNEKLVDLLKTEQNSEELLGMNLFSRNSLTSKFPVKELLQLSEGKEFEKIVSIPNNNNDSTPIVIKGNPIVSNEVFKGGIILIERQYSENESANQFTSPVSSFTKFLNRICTFYLILNPAGQIEYISSSIKQEHSLLSEKHGSKIFDVFNSESERSIKSILIDSVFDGNLQLGEISYFSDRQKINLNSVFVPITDSKNEVTAIVVMLRDTKSVINDGISYLSNSNNLHEYESFATAGADGLFKINLHGKISYIADNAVKLFELNKSDIIDEFIGKIFPEITQEYFEQVRKKIINNGSWEGYLIDSSINSENLFRVKVISRDTNNKTDLYVYCTKLDKQQQNIISAREEEKLFFTDAVLKSNQMILQVNPNGTILFANEKFCEIFEYDMDEICGKGFIDLIEYKAKTKYDIIDVQSLSSRHDIEILPLLTKYGSMIEVSYNINISTINTDLKYFTIYLRKHSVQDKLFLEASHALLYQFSAPIVIIQDDQIIKVNPKFCEMFGSKFEADFYNLDYNAIVSHNSVEKFKQILDYNSSNEYSDIVTLTKVNGQNFEAKVKKICCSKDSSFSVMTIEIEESSDEIFDRNNDQIKTKFKNYGPYYWSGRFENNEIVADYIDSDFIKSIGYTGNESVSQFDFMNQIIHPDDHERVESEIVQILNENPNTENSLIYRIINKIGEVVWINNKIIIEQGENEESNTLIGSITDVTQRNLEREELKSIIDELDKLNTAKEKFISIISHDLKSPFTSIVGFAELILTDSTLSKDEIIEFVGHIKEASFHTVDLLNSLLDLTKLQTGRIDVEPKIINANYIANKTVEILSGLAFQKGLSLKSSVDPSFYITADENLIFQVFNNLVANSIKFTPKGGEIEILARELRDQQKVEFTIKDSGVGIDKEDLKKLFVIDKKFTTLGTDGERGTGLGLSLVNEIVEKHLGEIYVESEVGKGSKFIFTLPISSPSILVVDGNQVERVLYTKLIDSITESIEVTSTPNEDEALRLIKDTLPMLIVFEHNLPNMKGDEFIGELKKAGLHYEPSLLILTREFNEELEKSYKSIGVNAVFGKPFELKKFKKQLDQLIGKPE